MRDIMEDPELFKAGNAPERIRRPPREYKVVALRDCPVPETLMSCVTPIDASTYWRLCIATTPQFESERESFVTLLLTTRRRIKGHHVVATGVMDTVNVHAREVFRTAIVAAAHSVVLMHNHPGGDPSPSDADIRITRDLIRAGHLLRIEVLDHVIVGAAKHCSLRELGYFAV